ncbi:MAG: 5-formyltetrahydrofolate cyclo-ligase [Lachnospiraceae bacterium]|nr:5-formyltetrahydrofolate cyclo-ligase [Lachnospiraceae bacterium]MBP5222098.1 5-formyltetrahydrofolate cyclo-ligase [Lachnospiraceae bacterium]
MSETENVGLHERKKMLRKELLARRDALTDADRVRAEILITERLLGHQWFYGSDVLLAFASYGSEISTAMLIEEALRKGKKVYLPKVEGSEIVFYRYEEPEDLTEGYKGIREPSGRTQRYCYLPEETGKTLLLMPGVGFDLYRNRLGYGKGFYDRFLKDKEELQIRSIGIGHACQLADEIPAGEADLKPYQVICV